MVSHPKKTALHKFAPASELGPAEDYPVGSIEWAERISNRLQIAAESVNEHTVHHLANTIKVIWATEPHPWEIWPEDHPFGTPNDYCEAVTGHSWEFLVAVIAEFSDEPGLTVEAMLAGLAKAQAEHRPQGAHHKNLKVKPGETRDYLLRRLARQRPDLLTAYQEGRFKSVRATAIEAGFITPPTPLQIILKLLPKLTNAEKCELWEILGSEEPPPEFYAKLKELEAA